jgi:hypothetical protein
MTFTWIRRSVLTVALVPLVAMPVRAQRLGIVAGGTFSQLRGLDNVQAKNRSGTVFGLSLKLPMSGRVALQPELLFINKGSKVQDNNTGTADIRLDYLEIPLLRFDRSLASVLTPHFYLGPSLSYNVGCNVKVSTSPGASSDCKRDMFFEPNHIDWGAVVGAGLDLNLGGFGVTGGARYGVGMANVSKDDGPALEQRVRNGTLTVYAGLLFGRR